MKKIALSLVAAAGLSAAMSAPALSASAINLDKETRIIVVTERGTRNEVSIPAGQSVQICQSGCFVTMPDGDREALTGIETIEISNGKGRVR